MTVEKLYRFLIPLLFFPTLLFSQNKYDWEQLRDETGKYYSAPFSWNSNDLITLGIISAGTITLMQFDDNIKNEFSKINSEKDNWLMEAGRYWGEPLPSLALSGILLIHGISTNNLSTKKIGFEIAQSFIYSVSVTSVLKISIGRARPYTGNSSATFSPFALHNSNWSLPSGHSTVAFSLSTILAANTNNNFLKVAAFIPAVLTITSRMYQDYHWASDVFLGAAIGYFTAKYITNIHHQNELNPTINNTPLISFSLNF